MTHRTFKSSSLLTLVGVVCLTGLLTSPDAQAESSAAGEEFLSNAEAAPPNILFLIDLSDEMLETCNELGDTGDSGDSGGGGASFTAGSSSASGNTCLEDTLDAIDQLTQHYDWAYFGVIGTSDSSSKDHYEPIAPLGSSHAEISAALDLVTGSGTDVRNLAESLDGAWDYLGRASAGDTCPSYASTSLVSGADFCGTPISWACQETHIVVITADLPDDDDGAGATSSGSSMSNDVMCEYSSGISTTSDTDCLYDNAAHYLYNKDARGDLTGDQNAVVHTVGIKLRGTSVAENLYGNAMSETSGDGIYTVANSGDEILGSIMTIMGYVRSGFYSRSAPTVSADGDFVVYSFYEITGDNPLAEGHVRMYSIDTDPTSPDYGSVEYDSSKSQFGGAIWDAGDLLVSRPVYSGEDNEDDFNGLNTREIYTFVPEFMSYSSLVTTEANTYHRMGFDVDFVDSVSSIVSGSDATFMDNFLLGTDADSDGCPDDQGYNLYDYDSDCTIDSDDLQALVDFVRGYPSAQYRYLDQLHGNWKLGDSPHSRPVIVDGRDEIYAIDPTYRAFLDNMEDNPGMVYIAANDGMLHAFRMEDDPSTSCSATGSLAWDCYEEGEELWAWIPAHTLYAEKDEDWSGSLIDMMWYGRTFLFDGSPVVEDVWIDGSDGSTADGAKDPDGDEWRRVLVVQQGKGGPVTLALDITDPEDPQFLWEQTNTSDLSAMGYTVSRPVITNVYNSEDPTDQKDTWVAMWGGGRAVPYGTSSKYYASSEANLYMWNVGDDYWGTQSVGYSEAGSNDHPDDTAWGGGETSGTLSSDSDSAFEYGYISGALAAVDVDSDGDADVVYFPVTAAYEPSDLGDPDGDGLTGTSDLEDPGHTWMFKAIIDNSDPDDPTWCEFYDPNDSVGARPEVYYAATTTFHGDGSLGVYWGSGTPYDRDSSETGYFFAVRDTTPLGCTTATAIDDCGTGGAFPLNAGESLTGEPVVFAGTVYFPTYEPASDRCTTGTGRIYGLDFQDCAGNMDSDGDGTVDSDAIEVDGYPSSVSIGAHGQLYYGTSDVGDGTNAIGEITAASDPFMSTRTLGMREVF